MINWVVRSTPHMWGWTEIVGVQKHVIQSTPHMWGWTENPHWRHHCHSSTPHMWGWTVFYTTVFEISKNLPHTCGDEPLGKGLLRRVEESTPHMWGWTDDKPPRFGAQAIYSTHIGKILNERKSYLELPGITKAPRQRFLPLRWACRHWEGR